MGGQELDRDGTDSYHAEHPWEQVGHPLYVAPHRRAKSNWPPEPAYPSGPAEAMAWNSLPDAPPTWTNEWRKQHGTRP